MFIIKYGCVFVNIGENHRNCSCFVFLLELLVPGFHDVEVGQSNEAIFKMDRKVTNKRRQPKQNPEYRIPV